MTLDSECDAVQHEQMGVAVVPVKTANKVPTSMGRSFLDHGIGLSGGGSGDRS